ncbi:IS4 family transposase [Endozoicomonas sp. Mp262]|uniref:IS4 family transposase n=1 Tax=Endozoicomonas sp. Mp262 TaxID=2919499 RepID=UPI0021D8CEEF
MSCFQSVFCKSFTSSSLLFVQHTHSLEKQLKASFNWHQSRINLMALAIFGLIQVGTVSLSRIAQTMGHHTEIDSRRKRLKRFLMWKGFELDCVARMVVDWMVPEGNWIVCLDRSNWQFGKFKINIMMVAIAYKGTAIPIVWTLLPKKGMSSMEERITLLKRFINLLGTERIQYLTADREFRGEKWLKWLIAQKIPFRIRIPNDTRTMNRHRTEKLKAYRFFSLKVGESMHLNHARELWGVRVFLSCYRSEQERVIIISNEAGQEALGDYMRRWEIETLFQALKGRGFDLESTHLSDRERIERLLGIVTLAYCWAYCTGEWRAEIKPIKRLKHGRLANSIFRYGLEWLASLLFDRTSSSTELMFHIEMFGQPVRPATHCDSKS